MIGDCCTLRRTNPLQVAHLIEWGAKLRYSFAAQRAVCSVYGSLIGGEAESCLSLALASPRTIAARPRSESRFRVSGSAAVRGEGLIGLVISPHCSRNTHLTWRRHIKCLRHLFSRCHQQQVVTKEKGTMKTIPLFVILLNLCEPNYKVAEHLCITPSTLSRLAHKLSYNRKALERASQYFNDRFQVGCDPHLLTTDIDVKTLVEAASYIRSHKLRNNPK
jgi:hypothetical protein